MIMRVLLTGGTGYIGAFTLRQLIDRGHEPRLLVRSPDRLRTTAEAIGIDPAGLDVVVGDMTDADAVSAAAKGCDAAIHAAAVVAALNRSDAARTVDVNVEGTRLVVSAALAAGCDPVVHLSSVAALFDPTAAVITTDMPPAVTADSPYTRSKALSDALVRGFQDSGHPVVVVYPGGVTGPAVGSAAGELAEGFVSMLRAGCVVLSDGAVGVIDVRDLAEVIVACLTPGQGPRRFMAGGQLVTLREIAAVLRALTGRRMPVLPTPGWVFRGLGHVVDGVRRVAPFETVFTAEAMDLLTLARPTDDSAVHEQLGVGYRAPEESIEASLRALRATGRLSAKQVGRLSGA
jgi:nucleoside-diphosphate-sugar epimerase